MGNELFGIDIAGIVADTIGPGLLTVTITRTPNTAERTDGNLTGGFVKGDPQVWTAQGFFEDFTGTPPPGVEIEADDRRAVVIGDTIPPGVTIERNDALTIEGETLYVVKALSRDPAAAAFTYQCRDRGQPGA